MRLLLFCLAASMAALDPSVAEETKPKTTEEKLVDLQKKIDALTSSQQQSESQIRALAAKLYEVEAFAPVIYVFPVDPRIPTAPQTDAVCGRKGLYGPLVVKTVTPNPPVVAIVCGRTRDPRVHTPPLFPPPPRP